MWTLKNSLRILNTGFTQRGKLRPVALTLHTTHVSPDALQVSEADWLITFQTTSLPPLAEEMYVFYALYL